jgi:hypothetical protein
MRKREMREKARIKHPISIRLIGKRENVPSNTYNVHETIDRIEKRKETEKKHKTYDIFDNVPSTSYWLTRARDLCSPSSSQGGFEACKT